MKAHVGVDKDSVLIHWVATTGANVQDVTRAAELLHGEERVFYGDAGYQGLEEREEMAGRDVECRITMRPSRRRGLPETPEGRLLRWRERAQAHIRAKVEHPFRMIKQQFRFQKTRLRGMTRTTARCWSWPLSPVSSSPGKDN
ncbi:MAG: transposase [Synechococcus sp. SB0677_bin_5]|nr:transposase [Synechococcus sp. SB0677_bin_5]